MIAAFPQEGPLLMVMELSHILQLHNLYITHVKEHIFAGDEDSITDFLSWMRMMKNRRFPNSIVTGKMQEEFDQIYEAK
jgi:hypothetical protein